MASSPSASSSSSSSLKDADGGQPLSLGSSLTSKAFDVSAKRPRTQPNEPVQATNLDHGTRGDVQFQIPVAGNPMTTAVANLNSTASLTSLGGVELHSCASASVAVKSSTSRSLSFPDLSIPLPAPMSVHPSDVIDNEQTGQASLPAGATFPSADTTRLPHESLQRTPSAEQTPSREPIIVDLNIMPKLQSNDMVAGSELPGSGTKRKIPMSDTNRDESIECYCRMSQCLSRRCRCFAAMQYCGYSCICVLCNNTHKHKDIVEEERQRIEKRGTPQSRRQMDWCACKKSRCQIHRCTCYKNKRSCSNRCDCIDCGNHYGKKEDQQQQPAEGNQNSTFT